MIDYFRAIIDAARAFENTTGRKPKTVYFAKGERIEAEAQFVKMYDLRLPEGQSIAKIASLDLCSDLRLEPGVVRVDDVPVPTECS